MQARRKERGRLKSFVRCLDPGDAIVVELPKFGKRDAYLALNAAAHAVFGPGHYSIKAPRGETSCVLKRLP